MSKGTNYFGHDKALACESWGFVYKKRGCIVLTHPLEILHLLLDERGKVFSRQELIDRIWPKDVLVLDRTVDVNITRLRKKIGRFSKCIVTRLGFGYYFDA